MFVQKKHTDLSSNRVCLLCHKSHLLCHWGSNVIFSSFFHGIDTIPGKNVFTLRKMSSYILEKELAKYSQWNKSIQPATYMHTSCEIRMELTF